MILVLISFVLLISREASSFSSHIQQAPTPLSAPTSDNSRRTAYYTALEQLNWNELRQDIKLLLMTSKDFWPADFGNYGPLMIRTVYVK